MWSTPVAGIQACQRGGNTLPENYISVDGARNARRARYAQRCPGEKRLDGLRLRWLRSGLEVLQLASFGQLSDSLKLTLGIWMKFPCQAYAALRMLVIPTSALSALMSRACSARSSGSSCRPRRWCQPPHRVVIVADADQHVELRLIADPALSLFKLLDERLIGFIGRHAAYRIAPWMAINGSVQTAIFESFGMLVQVEMPTSRKAHQWSLRLSSDHFPHRRGLGA